MLRPSSSILSIITGNVIATLTKRTSSADVTGFWNNFFSFNWKPTRDDSRDKWFNLTCTSKNDGLNGTNHLHIEGILMNL